MGCKKLDVYTFKEPLLNTSEKRINIYNDKKEKVGQIQRYYKKKWHSYLKVMDFNLLSVNVIAYNKNGEEVCKLEEIFTKKTLFQCQWKGISKQWGKYTLLDKTKVTTNLRLECKVNRLNEIRLEKDIGNRVVYVKNKESSILAEITYGKTIKARDKTIKICSDEVSALDILSMYFVLSLQSIS